MNILVTGASGFIGRRLCRRLMQSGHQVFGLSTTKPSDTDGFADYYFQNLSQPFHLDRMFDFVIHLAAYNITNIGSQDADLYTHINVNGTKYLLDAVQSDHFIYLSTTKVYKNEGLPLTEDSPLGPAGGYEQSKLKAEELCRSLINKDRLIILRSVNVMGPGQAIKAVLPVFFQKAKNHQPLDIIVSPGTAMQFVYVDDLINAFESIINHPSTSGVFNIASDQVITLEEFAHAVIRYTNSASVVNTRTDTSKHVFSPVVCDRAHQQLGWKPKTSLEQILEHYEGEYATS